MTDSENINVSTERTAPEMSPNYSHTWRCLLSVGTSCPPETARGLISTLWLPPEGAENTGLWEGRRTRVAVRRISLTVTLVVTGARTQYLSSADTVLSALALLLSSSPRR